MENTSNLNRLEEKHCACSIFLLKKKYNKNYSWMSILMRIGYDLMFDLLVFEINWLIVIFW